MPPHLSQLCLSAAVAKQRHDVVDDEDDDTTASRSRPLARGSVTVARACPVRWPLPYRFCLSTVRPELHGRSSNEVSDQSVRRSLARPTYSRAAGSRPSHGQPPVLTQATIDPRYVGDAFCSPSRIDLRDLAPPLLRQLPARGCVA